jgi:hypothetical protein
MSTTRHDPRNADKQQPASAGKGTDRGPSPAMPAGGQGTPPRKDGGKQGR